MRFALLVGTVAIVIGLTILAQSFVRRPLPSIAVLPFGNLSDEKGNAYFVDGVQDEIITDLSRVPDLKVISRTSVMPYRDDASRNLRDIGRALGVTHVLEGNVQRVGNHVRVHAQLVDARTDQHLWADRYDSDETDVFDIQSEIAQRIVAQLKIKLSAQVKAAIAERPTNDPVAYDLYVRAKGLINAAVFSASANEDLNAAVRDLDEAVARDHKFHLAYCQLASAHDQLYQRFDRTPARLALAEAALRKAVALRPDSGETHLALAKHYYSAMGDFDRARRELAQAEAKLPNDSVPPLLSGYIDRRQGRWNESTRNLNRALELDPQNNAILRQLALSYFNLRRFPEMATVLQRAINLAPEDLIMRAQLASVELEWHADTQPLHEVIEKSLRENPSNGAILAEQWMYLALCERDNESAARALASLSDHGCYTEGMPLPRSWCEGMVARLRGDETAARAAFRRGLSETAALVSARPDDGGVICVLGLLHAALGENEEAIRAGRRAVELVPMEKDAIDAPLMVGYLAIIYSWAGENDLAIEQLTNATKVPSYWSYGNLRLHPYWDTLRKDPRFAQIVESLAPKEH